MIAGRTRIRNARPGSECSSIGALLPLRRPARPFVLKHRGAVDAGGRGPRKSGKGGRNRETREKAQRNANGSRNRG